MTRRTVDQLADGDNLEETYLAVEKQLRANRNGNLFLQVELRDRTGVIPARMWNAGEPLFKSFENGDFIFVKGKAQLFQGSLQAILTHIERTDPNRIELTDFLPHTEKNVDEMLGKVRLILRKIGDMHLKALAECYLMDDGFLNAFRRAPAGVRVHHAYVGGLLEHVLTMLEIAEKLAPLYPAVDRDLLIVGVFLHDTGKVRELTFASAFGYSDEGQLLGHLALGQEMLEAKLSQTRALTGEPFPRETALRLKHMILSHHGTLEHGSPKIPMTPEAVALHEIDSLDTRLHIALREIHDDRNNATAWTPFNNALQRRLFKGGTAAGTSPVADPDD